MSCTGNDEQAVSDLIDAGLHEKEMAESCQVDPIVSNEYLNEFANTMMDLSNRLNEIDDEFDNAYDIKDNYLPLIQKFIFKITGL